jgi:hypothetical protein
MGGSLIFGINGGNAGAGTGGGGGGGAASGPAVFVNAGSLTIVNTTATGSTATAGAAGTGLSGHNGAAGTANSTSLFNYAGAVDSSGTTGPLAVLDPAASVPALSTWAMILLFIGLVFMVWRLAIRNSQEA